MGRDFTFAEEDLDYLEGSGLAWDTVVEGPGKAGNRWLILRGFAIPAGYNVAVTDAALRIPPSYPDEQIDMVYFHPGLSLASGRGIRQLTPHAVEGKQYQQWSRHRTPANPWRPGLDNLSTHMLMVKTWLERELRAP